MNTMNMTKRRVYVPLLLIISITLTCYCFFISDSSKNVSTDGYSMETFKSADGWGYQIKKGKKTIIVQPFIPCLIGEKPFPDEKSAMKIGEFVLSKIRNDEDPSITIEELNNRIRINYD